MIFEVMISIGHFRHQGRFTVLPEAYFYGRKNDPTPSICCEKSLQAMTNVKNINVLAGQMKTLQAGCEYLDVPGSWYDKRRLGSVGYTPDIQ